MRGLLRLLVLMTLLLGTAGASADTRGLTIKLKASEAKNAPITEEVRLYGSSHALVIGIDAYTGGWPRLSNAVKDAELVAAELRGRGFEVTLKTNLAAAELEGAFKEFFIVKGADSTARLFVWYAGHGYSEDDEGVPYSNRRAATRNRPLVQVQGAAHPPLRGISIDGRGAPECLITDQICAEKLAFRSRFRRS